MRRLVSTNRFQQGIALGLLAFALGMALPGYAESVQALVSKANHLAAEEKYAEAIPLYEQIVRQAPTESTLKRNLSVLYVNYGIALQNQKQYTQAEVYFEKALKLDPTDHHAKKAKAGGLFQQAMDLREQDSPDFEAIKAYLDQAIALDPQEPVFIKAKASVLHEQSFRWAEQEQFEAAIPLLEEALRLTPDDASLKKSLANVYIGLAQQNPAQRDQWADKAVEVFPTEQIKTIVARVKAGPEAVPPMGNFQMGASQLPKEAASLSVQDMLLDVENELGIARNPDQSLTERLVRAEHALYGEGKVGPVADRTRNLYATLKGTQVIHGEGVMQAPLETSQYSYIEEIFKVTDGKVVRWGKFPLRVYIEEPEDNPRYQPEYKQAILAAMDLWKEKTQDVVSYVEVKNPDAADVRFFWTDQYVDRFADPETVPDFYQTYSPPKKNHMIRLLQVASMFAPGYFSLAPQAMGAMLQYKQLKKLEVIREESVVHLGLEPVEGLDLPQAQVLIQNMAAQEFGHVLGLKGHSLERGDLMYPELRHDKIQEPTRRDLETLRQLYNRPANIVLNVR